jgi:hypothetical protein
VVCFCVYGDGDWFNNGQDVFWPDKLNWITNLTNSVFGQVPVRQRKWYCAAWSGLSHTSQRGDRWVCSNGGMMMSRGGNWRNSKRNLLQCHFVDRKFHMKSLGIEPEAPRWEARNVTAWAMVQPSRKPKGESRTWLAIITERPCAYSWRSIGCRLMTEVTLWTTEGRVDEPDCIWHRYEYNQCLAKSNLRSLNWAIRANADF